MRIHVLSMEVQLDYISPNLSLLEEVDPGHLSKTRSTQFLDCIDVFCGGLLQCVLV